MTHYPPVSWPDENMADILRWTLDDPSIPEQFKQPSGWPEEMRREYGSDNGKRAAATHRAALVSGFDRLRQRLDEFEPDVVLVWGDDQYENFREDIIPPFCVLGYDAIVAQPWKRSPKPNYWGESADKSVEVHGHREFAKHLTSGLLAEGFDVPYSYKPLHHDGLPHAFLNTVLYLDYQRKGFLHPLVSFSINCYGRKVISQKGGLGRFADIPPDHELDPPSPSPDRCFDLGRAAARVVKASPYRVALIASSSWSHAFLHDKTWRLYPDLESDRRFYQALKTGDYAAWRGVPLSAIEDSGQQEMLNWFCLVGAMEELGRKPSWSDFIETYALNSNKCFAIFEP
jgi:hypothetical protein